MSYVTVTGKVTNNFNAKPERAEVTLSNVNRMEIREIQKTLKKNRNFEQLKEFNEKIKQLK